MGPMKHGMDYAEVDLQRANNFKTWDHSQQRTRTNPADDKRQESMEGGDGSISD